MNQTAGSYYVYVLFRPWDGSPFYVGKGKGRRYLQHAKRPQTPYIRRIFLKAEHLRMEIPCVLVRENLSELDAFSIEVALISAIGRHDQDKGPLANLTDGGEGASNPSKSTLHKRSKKMRGRSPSQETRDKTSQTLMGHGVAWETREKIGEKSAAMWGDLVTRIRLIEINRARKYSPSDEVRESARIFHTGRKKTSETREKMRKAALRREAAKRAGKGPSHLP